MRERARHFAGPQANLRVGLLLGLLAVYCLASVVSADEPAPPAKPLHERIDALVESSTLGPLAAPAADADFLRRAYLDLNGTIPDAATARAFLDDPSPAKRQALVDRLLARPHFARHMANVFDVLLMERRPQRSLPAAEYNVAAAEWQEYLRKSFADNKPLDQLAREILAADGADPALRPAVKFYLDREADPNLLARDIGRLFFGRDLQCAQCHDHPLVDDYLQGDYYGLMAFVSRGTLFDDTKQKKSYYAENGDGDVNYKSVFTGEARDHVRPKLPDGAALPEPVLTKEEAYVVAPTKDVRGVPKYSRRAQLASVATGGASAAFNRNLANRLWAMMMGRGLAHPLDMQHSGNPAVQSALLAMLGDELVKLKFDTKAFVRELALTRSYARASETPLAESLQLDPAVAAATLAQWKADVAKLAAEVPALQAAYVETSKELATVYEKYSAAAAARDAAEKARAETKKAGDELSAALAAAVKEVSAKDETLKAVIAAREAAKVAAAKLPEDKPLAEAATLYNTRANEVDTQLAAARQTVGEKTPQVQAATLKLGEADKVLAVAAAELTTNSAALDAVETKNRDAQQKLRLALARQAEFTARVADAESVLAYQALATTATASQNAAQAANDSLATLKTQTSATAEQTTTADTAARAAVEKAAADRDAALQAFATLGDRSTVRFTLAPLKDLTPEQLSWATMQSLGLVDQQVAALGEQAKKDVEAMANVTPEQRPAEEQKLLEARVDEKLRGNLGTFVSLFGQQPGQAPSFQSTVHQALFLSNGGVLAGWLNPGGNNLTERLAKIVEPAQVADELYLSVLTRRPTPDEQARVAAYWETGKADRAAAAREMTWALVTSAEFRFNH